MKNLPVNKSVSYFVPSLITTGLFVSSTLLAMPLQNGITTTSKSAKETEVQTRTATGNLTKSPVLARNTMAKPEPVARPVTTTASVQKNHDKKAISRCWKRLMSMVREVSHARHTKNK